MSACAEGKKRLGWGAVSREWGGSGGDFSFAERDICSSLNEMDLCSSLNEMQCPGPQPSLLFLFFVVWLLAIHTYIHTCMPNDF